jgi:hypothetical protein
VLTTVDTLQEAIDWAKTENFTVQVALVRNTSNGNRDHWVEV